MGAAKTFWLVCIIILAVILILIILACLGFSLGCQSTDGLHYPYKYLTTKHGLSNKQRHQILYDMMDVFLTYTKHMTVWPVYGTLLGLIRDGKIICYDFDLDFAIYEDQWVEMQKTLQLIVKENPEYGYMWYSYKFMRFGQLYHRKTMINCDVSVYTVKNGQVLRNLVLNDFIYNTEDVFPLDRKTFENPYTHEEFTINMPSNPDRLLRVYYGDNYINPDHKCDDDCENCVKIESINPDDNK